MERAVNTEVQKGDGPDGGRMRGWFKEGGGEGGLSREVCSESDGSYKVNPEVTSDSAAVDC